MNDKKGHSYTPSKAPGLKLSTKILWLAGIASLLAAVTMGVANFWRTKNLLRETARDNVAYETRLIAHQLGNVYRVLENDTFVLSRMPPVEAAIRLSERSPRSSTPPPVTESHERLASIFSALMRDRPQYTQIRLIGAADNGRELVRVNRRGDDLVTVPAEQLQQKGQEPYFLRAKTLQRDEAYFSDVTYNREHGEIEQSLTPTIRSVVPVIDQSGNFAGAIVINANYAALLQHFLNTIKIDREIIISNHSGDYITYEGPENISDLNFHDDKKYESSKLLFTINATNQDEWTWHTEDKLAYSVRLRIGKSLDDAHHVITVAVPYNKLYAPARAAMLESLVLSALLAAGTMAATLLASRKLTLPLRQVTAAIKRTQHQGLDLQLPNLNDDEVGELSDAFQKLYESRREQDARVRAVINNVVDAIISIDSHGAILDYNPAAQRTFGYSPQEVVGQNIKILMPDEISEHHDMHLAKYREKGEEHIIGFTRELQGRRKDGTQFPLELSVSRIDLNQGGYIFTGIIRDITERKKIELLQNEFISTVNHELRTPLAAIRASLGMLQSRATDALDEKSQRLILLSLKGCDRLTHLVNDILDIDKISAGKMQFQNEVCDIAELTASVVDQFGMLADSHDVIFEVDTPSTEVCCLLDPSRFSQALVNLLSNAAKFSPPGERVTIRVQRGGDDNAVISVSDRGPGIPETFHSKVFDRFTQADGSSSRPQEGSGLGLSITKAIIEACGGRISFESVEGRGSTFFLHIPLSTAFKEPAA